jgi:hypothetical protein
MTIRKTIVNIVAIIVVKMSHDSDVFIGWVHRSARGMKKLRFYDAFERSINFI